jgi:hypothetical protein
MSCLHDDVGPMYVSRVSRGEKPMIDTGRLSTVYYESSMADPGGQTQKNPKIPLCAFQTK